MLYLRILNESRATSHLRCGRRLLSDIWGCWVWLRADWHTMGDYGVEGQDGHELDMRLKRECQKRFEELYGHDTFMAVFKKNYLDDESC